MGAIDAQSDPLLGTSVGRYRLVRVVGEGGMGRVYEGIDPAIGSRVAIKVIAEAYARDAELAERFFAEARAVNMIRHESIVNVLEHTKLPDGRPLIVMEFIEGHTLRDLLGAGPAPLGGITIVMLEVLGALSAAHAIGIVHRDLKPDNILVTPSGRVKVLDFGIAKLLKVPDGQSAPRTRTGVVLGTPEYMSPEQISGGMPDARSDVYAMGVVMFEAVTGRRPFEGASDFEVMRAHVSDPPPRPRELRPDLPELIEEVMLVALAKHPRDRFASANAMAVALHAASAALAPEQWRPLAGTGRVPRPSLPTLQPLPAASLDTLRVAQVDAEAGRLDVRTARATPGRRQRDAEPPTVRDLPSALDEAPYSADQPAPYSADRPVPEAAREPAATRRRWPLALAFGGVAAAGGIAFVVGRHTAGTPPPPPPPPQSPAPQVVVAVPSQPAPATAPVDAGITPMPVDAAITAVARTHSPKPVSIATLSLPAPVPAIAGSPVKSFPATYNPRKFDPSAFLATALTQARAAMPDAELALFSFRGVTSDGLLDAGQLSPDSALMFRSPSAAVAKPPSGPPNLPFKRLCMVTVTPHETSYDVLAAPTETCMPSSLQAPRCTLAEVWKKAKDQGIDPSLAASLTLMAKTSGAKTQRWYFDTGGHPLVLFDDCGLASPSDNPADPKPSLPGMQLLPPVANAPYDEREAGRFSVPLPKPAPQLDTFAYTATATQLARLLEPDAKLERLEFRPVDSKGHLIIRDWRSDDRHEYVYWFYSAARAAAKPGPNGVLMCEIVVEIDTHRGDKAYVKRLGDQTCPNHVPKPPTCSLAAIWAKGLAKGAPATGEASITYYDNGEWWFDDQHDDGGWQRMTFADDCH